METGRSDAVMWRNPPGCGGGTQSGGLCYTGEYATDVARFARLRAGGAVRDRPEQL